MKYLTRFNLIGLVLGFSAYAKVYAEQPLPGHQLKKAYAQISVNDVQKAVHECIFDSVLPETDSMSSEIVELRRQVRTNTFTYVKANPQINAAISLLYPPNSQALPGDLKDEYPEIIEKGIHGVDKSQRDSFLMGLRRHKNADIRKAAHDLRKAYVFLAYGTRLPGAKSMADLLSGVDTSPQPPKKVDYELPQSRLVFENGEIKHRNGDIDYLIVGTGPAGALISAELSRLRPDLKVVVLETGSFVKPGSMDTTFAPQLMESSNLRTTADGAIVIRNGQAVGGGSAVNVDLAFSPELPAIRNRLDQWIREGKVREDLFNPARVAQTYEWLMKRIGTRQPETHELNRNNRILGWGAIEEGLNPARYFLNAAKPNGNDEQILKISAVDAFLSKALKHEDDNDLSIIPNAQVTRLLLNDKPHTQVNGVEIEFTQPWEGEHVVANPNQFDAKVADKALIKAKNVILSAGALGSAALMLRSFPENEQVGKGIVIHPSFGFPARFPAPINNMSGISASVYVPSKKIEEGYFFESMASDALFGALINPGRGQELVNMVENFDYYAGFGIMLVDEPVNSNQIKINSKGEPEVHYTLSDEAKVRMKHGIKTGMKIIMNAFGEEINLPTTEPILSEDLSYHSITSKEQIDEAVDKLQLISNQTFLSSAHLQSSNKMGSSSDNSVVSKNFRVWDQNTKQEIPNLYIVDGSVFPTSCGANPMQTIYTTAKLFVDGVLLNKNKIVD